MQEAIEQALAGSRKLRVTFKKEGASELVYLFGMANSGVVEIDPMDYVVLLAVKESNDWDGDENRTTTLTLTEDFDEEWFVSRMRRAIESAQAV